LNYEIAGLKVVCVPNCVELDDDEGADERREIY
jgi:hypothetical protein